MFGLKKVFRDDLYRKLAFLDHKNTDLKKSQNLRFSKEVSPCFSQKFQIDLSFFFLGKYCLGKVFGEFPDSKIAVLDHKNTDL